MIVQTLMRTRRFFLIQPDSSFKTTTAWFSRAVLQERSHCIRKNRPVHISVYTFLDTTVRLQLFLPNPGRISGSLDSNVPSTAQGHLRTVFHEIAPYQCADNHMHARRFPSFLYPSSAHGLCITRILSDLLDERGKRGEGGKGLLYILQPFYRSAVSTCLWY